jgi:hypothetical protein
MKHTLSLITLTSVLALTSCAGGGAGGFGDYGARASNDRRQSHKLISSADEEQFERQRRNESSESRHQRQLQNDQIGGYLAPLEGLRSGLNTAVGIGNVFR